MKKQFKKFVRNKYFPHGAVISVLIVLAFFGWMTPFMLLYIGYLLYLFAKLIILIVKDTKSRLLKYLSAFVLCFGLAPGFAIGMIPLWFIRGWREALELRRFIMLIRLRLANICRM